MILPIMMLLCIMSVQAQDVQQPSVIVISSSSTPEYIGEMKEQLAEQDIILNVEKEIWKNKEELEAFSFTLTNKQTKSPTSFEFNYNELNKHMIFMVYPLGDQDYGQVMTDVTYLKAELLPIIINTSIKKKKPILHRSYSRSGLPYRESIVMTDLRKLEKEFGETLSLFKKIKADQMVGRSISGITYTYNGQILDDPAGINLTDMKADVLIETLSDNSKIINIWSDAPLNELIMGTAAAGQR